jgi:hypothetical protein
VCEKTKATEYRSDYLGRMEEIVYPDGEAVKYDYDQGGQIRKVTGTRLGVWCALRVKPKKIADQAIFYLANSESSPIIYKCNRLLGRVTALIFCTQNSLKIKHF